MSARDNVTLYVGATSPERELLHNDRCAVTGLRWSNVMPGGYGSASFTLETADPHLPVFNELKADAKVWIKAFGQTVYAGWILPLETSIGPNGGTINVECAGGLERAKRNTAITYTAVDRDMGNWWQPKNNNGQFVTDNQGHLLIAINKGSAATGSAYDSLGYSTWVYYVDEGLATARNITKVTWDDSYSMGISGANVTAWLDIMDRPYVYGGQGGSATQYSLNAATWYNLAASSRTGQTMNADTTTYPNPKCVQFWFYALADIAAAGGTRFVELTNVCVYTQAAIPTIDSALWDLLNGYGLVSSRDYATLDALNHCAYRSPQSVADMCADVAKRSNQIVDWALYDSELYCHYRAAATAGTTLAIKRGELGGDDTIVGDFENALDGVMVLYATDGTGTDAGYPSGVVRTATYGSTAAIGNRVETLDYSGEVMSPTEAVNIATRQYVLKNANAYRGSMPVPLSAPLTLASGGRVEPLLVAPKNAFLRRTYMQGGAEIAITGIDVDLDSETLTLSVGAQEERQLYQPWELPKADVRAVSKSKVVWRGKGKNRRKVIQRWTEFQ